MWTNVLNKALPPQQRRPDTQPEHPVRHTAQKKREKKRKKERKNNKVIKIIFLIIKNKKIKR